MHTRLLHFFTFHSVWTPCSEAVFPPIHRYCFCLCLQGFPRYTIKWLFSCPPLIYPLGCIQHRWSFHPSLNTLLWALGELLSLFSLNLTCLYFSVCLWQDPLHFPDSRAQSSHLFFSFLFQSSLGSDILSYTFKYQLYVDGFQIYSIIYLMRSIPFLSIYFAIVGSNAINIPTHIPLINIDFTS